MIQVVIEFVKDCFFLLTEIVVVLIELQLILTEDADSRVIQQIVCTGRANAGVMIYCILEQSKETILQFFKSTAKVL